ncbi:MAG: hypothetical protein EHM84_05270 [Lysobacterales bacterium]|nr:MAG: hypothetical protein EHM84_05270 [Xanthomonadales bacterium]
MAFAWRKGDASNDFHIYEVEVQSRVVRQITSGAGVSDFEPVYLPDGSFVFASTRCAQVSAGSAVPATSIYTCESDGRYTRRLTFNPGSAGSLRILEDGCVLFEQSLAGVGAKPRLIQMNPDGTGQRERQAAAPAPSNRRADGRVALAPRTSPLVRSSIVDYSKTNATVFIEDAYANPRLAGLERGDIRYIRVVALECRSAAIGSNSVCNTPVSVAGLALNVRIVLGQAKVYPDGSAFFNVPARQPLCFQALDGNGRAIEALRASTALQPGEMFACVGCYDEPDSVPLPHGDTATQAARAGAQELESPSNPLRGFSFIREVQPILDSSCVSCHQDRSNVRVSGDEQNGAGRVRRRNRPEPGATNVSAFTLLGDTTLDSFSKRYWSDSYLMLTRARREPVGAREGAFRTGAARTNLVTLLQRGHRNVRLGPDELSKIVYWTDLGMPYCGDYAEANAWNEEEKRQFEISTRNHRDQIEEEQASIERLTSERAPPPPPRMRGGMMRRR